MNILNLFRKQTPNEAIKTFKKILAESGEPNVIASSYAKRHEDAIDKANAAREVMQKAPTEKNILAWVDAMQQAEATKVFVTFQHDLREVPKQPMFGVGALLPVKFVSFEKEIKPELERQFAERNKGAILGALNEIKSSFEAELVDQVEREEKAAKETGLDYSAVKSPRREELKTHIDRVNYQVSVVDGFDAQIGICEHWIEVFSK